MELNQLSKTVYGIMPQHLARRLNGRNLLFFIGCILPFRVLLLCMASSCTHLVIKLYSSTCSQKYGCKTIHMVAFGMFRTPSPPFAPKHATADPRPGTKFELSCHISPVLHHSREQNSSSHRELQPIMA